MNDAVVYVVNESNHNYTPAEKFGDVVFVTSIELSHLISCRNEKVYSDIAAAAEKYRPGIDFIVSAGNPATVAIFMMTVALRYGSATHKFLKWDNMAAKYVMYEVAPLLKPRGEIA